MNNISLRDYGLNDYFMNKFDEHKDKYSIGRVLVEYKGIYRLFTEKGIVLGKVSGKMIHNNVSKEDYPKVGDWVLIDKNIDETTIIYDILPRKSKISRKEAGPLSNEQVLAVNVDTIFICMSLNYDYNLRRLERYITSAWDSGATPVVLLTKADLCDDIEDKISELELTAPGVDILVTSSLEKIGLEDLNKYTNKGETIAFVGSSGVGKSSLINTLLKEEKQKVNDIREDDSKGKHTTTHREVLLLPDGGVVIDTPGMREFHIFDSEEGIDNTFKDIEELANNCKFNDCSHTNEPGCRVKDAVKSGEIPQKRLINYFKLKKEAEYIKRKEMLKEKKLNKKRK